MPKRSPDYMKDRRILFCEAAMACFRRKGVVGTSLTDICDETGLSMGALYKHFSSRDDLLAAVLTLRSERRNALLNGEHWTDLRAAMLTFRETANADPFWREFQGVTDWNANLRDLRVAEGKVVLEQVERQLARYKAAGEIDPPLDLRRTTQLISTIIDGSLMDVRAETDLHVSLEDLSDYLDLAVGLPRRT